MQREESQRPWGKKKQRDENNEQRCLEWGENFDPVLRQLQDVGTIEHEGFLSGWLWTGLNAREISQRVRVEGRREREKK